MKKILKSKIKDYEKQGPKFCQICQMNITFITNLDHMTFNHLLQQPMPSVVRRFNEKIDRNLELMQMLSDTDLTLSMTHKRIIPDGE